MKRLQIGWPAAAVCLIVVNACTSGLSPSLKRRVGEEHAALVAATKGVRDAEQKLKSNLASDAALFNATSKPAAWSSQMEDARRSLQTAEETDRQLAMLAGRNREEGASEIERLLTKERALDRSALLEGQRAAAESTKWVAFRNDLGANIARIAADHDALEKADLAELQSVVKKAEHDWPAKESILRDRLEAIENIRQTADSGWNASAKAREDAAHDASLDGPELAGLIETADALSNDRAKLAKQSDDLRLAAGQLYDSWDKILVDLDRRGDEYRERVRTVRTHFTDVEAKKTETSSSESWIEVPPSDYRSVQDDLGMAIAHKDAGQFDTEAANTPEPAGFAYIAPESEGSNRYGFWSHDGGHSVWTWLPQYLILRELLWNHAYRPVIIEDYRGYRTAQQAGHTYFGRAASSTSAPEYGTHGSFTRTTYANSRYVQSGSFRQSAYASHAGSPSSRSVFGESHEHASHAFTPNSSGGKRFGTGAAPSSGRRFGRSSPGRGFGRSFGRHR